MGSVDLPRQIHSHIEELLYRSTVLHSGNGVAENDNDRKMSEHTIVSRNVFRAGPGNPIGLQALALLLLALLLTRDRTWTLSMATSIPTFDDPGGPPPGSPPTCMFLPSIQSFLVVSVAPSNVPRSMVINTNHAFLDHWHDRLSYLLVLSDEVAPPLCA